MSNRRCVAACLVFLFAGGDAMASDKAARNISVAAVSFVPEKFNLENNAVKLEQMFRRASAGGAQIAVAPEGILEATSSTRLSRGKQRLTT